MKAIILGAAAIGLTASAAFADPDAGVTCRIQETRENHGTRLMAVARAARDTTARWRFGVETTGAGGTSSTAQSGGGALPAGEWVFLGEVYAGSPGRYAASLDVMSGAGRARCSADGI